MNLSAPLLAALLIGIRLPAQTIAGRVYDSVAKAPLAGATVTLVPQSLASATRMLATTDSTGHYTLNNVLPGRYILGFYHAVLDSIGIEQPFVHVQVDSGRGATSLRADLGVPGPTQILRAICG
ncbi:MAG TPA: carboxypeptidase-like regulatory domain-containing protein, partial [Gemmatimonadaceae bacterium]|nr:carboxypeptidase-like regulatory domain-containing protein [Gemmatimonadaceae bacterium]